MFYNVKKKPTISKLQVRTAKKLIYNMNFKKKGKIAQKIESNNGKSLEYAAPVLT